MLSDDIKNKIINFSSEKDKEYIIYVDNDFISKVYFVNGRSVVEIKPQPPEIDIVDIIRNGGSWITEPDSLHIYDEKLIYEWTCPNEKCNYSWHSRVRHPKECPRCQYRLDKKYERKD